MEILKRISQLSKIDFNGKGEAFVEQKFLTPLLECLGYEGHQDYEVLRHGDDGASFKLTYPPVENGAIKVKHYNPDYIPTIRKKMFWVIEAKSSKSVAHPFAYKYIVQGLQYCIHPEIQAQYLVLSNGISTCIYSPQSAVFFDQNIYDPIYEFKASELSKNWEEIYGFLGVEKLGENIEDNIRAQFEKLALSSLDENYPNQLIKKIGKNTRSINQEISKNVTKLYVKKLNDSLEKDQSILQSETLEYLRLSMEYPIRRGKEPSEYYVERRLSEGHDPELVFEELIKDYQKFNYFKKEHTIIAICSLHGLSKEKKLKDRCLAFINKKIAEPIPLLNKVESTLIRLVRKFIVIHMDQKLRSSIQSKLDSLPEIERFITRPQPRDYTYANELAVHDRYFNILIDMNDKELEELNNKLLPIETLIEEEFSKVQKLIPNGEKEINGFEYYGYGDKIYTLPNIAKNFGIIT